MASVALVTCVSLAPRGTKGSTGPSLTRLGFCRPPWAVSFVLGTGAVPALLGKGQMEGKRHSFRQRGLHWQSGAFSAQSQFSSQRWQGLVSSSGGQQGPSLWHSPRYEAVWKNRSTEQI